MTAGPVARRYFLVSVCISSGVPYQASLHPTMIQENKKCQVKSKSVKRSPTASSAASKAATCLGVGRGEYRPMLDDRPTW